MAWNMTNKNPNPIRNIVKNLPYLDSLNSPINFDDDPIFSLPILLPVPEAKLLLLLYFLLF